jgi:DNA invertase Pin-like site-specific DNA recombinase
MTCGKSTFATEKESEMPTPLVPVAQYLRKSSEHQQYSLAFQSSALKSYAEKNNFTIVQTYTDSKSGLVLKRRKGLVKLLHDVVAGGQPYKAILVYDVSRWGRFLDADESAHYEFLCKRAGIPVHYCAETFPNDGSMPSAIMKSVKRVMAAEFSRELSEKVTLAMTRMVRDGLWPGSMPGYGLRRLLASNDRTPKCPMRFGQRKNLRFDRTLIVPGPPEEVEIVKEIFRLYTGEKKSFLHIAGRLNTLGIPRVCNDSNVPWTYQAIRQIVLNEKYTGSLIWGRYTQKLRSNYRPVPKEKWIVVPNAFRPIIDRQAFEAAQSIWLRKTRRLSDEQFLERLRSLLKKKGRLNARIINESSLTPSCTAYEGRFGSLDKVYELIGYKRTDTYALRQLSHTHMLGLYRSVYRRLRRLFSDLRATHQSPISRPKKLCFSTGVTIVVAVCPAEKTLRGKRRWRFESRYAETSGLPTLLCLCNGSNKNIARFVLVRNASHIHTVAMLKEDDERLKGGIRLRHLRDFARVAHRMSRIS